MNFVGSTVIAFTVSENMSSSTSCVSLKRKLNALRNGIMKSSVKIVTGVAVNDEIEIKGLPAISSTEAPSTEMYVVSLSIASVKSAFIKFKSSSPMNICKI